VAMQGPNVGVQLDGGKAKKLKNLSTFIGQGKKIKKIEHSHLSR